MTDCKHVRYRRTQAHDVERQAGQVGFIAWKTVFQCLDCPQSWTPPMRTINLGEHSV